MALSVKHFINPLNCDEPTNEIGVSYAADLATGAQTICSGNGTLTNIYANYLNVGEIFTNNGTSNGSTSDICDDGIDVVFAIDYTSSMTGAIGGVKSGIANIINTIDTQSNGNYRIGIVIYDEYGGASPTYNYASSVYYQNIPASQKDFNYDTPSNRHQVFTCVEKMNLVGNSTSATTALNALATSNSSTSMSIGSGVGGAEPGGQAAYRIAANAFSGQWRSGVLKLVINVTDAAAGGVDDQWTSADSTYFQTILTPYFDNNNIQYYHNTSLGTNIYDANTYEYLADNTTPAGLYVNALNYSNNNWITQLTAAIDTLCDETTVYTCDTAPAGWYADVPVVSGTTICYYWDGIAWTSQYSCPPPELSLQLDIVDAITNGYVSDIPLNHPNYFDVDSFTFTGVEGATFTVSVQNGADPGYNNLISTISNISDSAIITQVLVNNANDQVSITVTMPASDQVESLQINGTATQADVTMRVDVIGGITATTDGSGNAQTPTGYTDPTAVLPLSGWTNENFTYGNYAIRYEFTGIPGSTHAIDTSFLPIPADYSLNVTGLTEGYLLLNGTTPPNSVIADAFTGFTTTTGTIDPDWSGTMVMPSTSGWAKITVNGIMDQPNYRYILNVIETINGGQLVSGDAQFILEGYTGDTFNISALIEPSSGYSTATVTSVQTSGSNPPVDGNGAISGLGVITGNTGAECIITMPEGGALGQITLNGSATQVQENFGVTFLDNYSSASWGPVNFTSTAGSAHFTNATATSSSGYTYNIASVNSDNSDLVPSIANSSGLTVGLSLSMPIGGGSAIVTVIGEEIQDPEDFTINMLTSVSPGSWAATTYTHTAVPGTVITGNFNWLEAPDYTYSATGVTSSNTADVTASLTTFNSLDTSYSITMPVGGGSANLGLTSPTATQTQHAYNIEFDNTQMSNQGNFTVNPTSQTIYGITGSTHNWQIDLDPSPSYYEIEIGNVTLHDGAGGTPSELTNYNTENNGQDIISGGLTMPLGGGTGYVMPKGGAGNPQYTFSVFASDIISNAEIPIADQVHNFVGVAGSTHTHTFDVVSDANYSHTVDACSVTNSYGGLFSASPTLGNDMMVTLTMPSYDASGACEASGTSTPIIFVGNIIYDDAGDLELEGDWDTGAESFSGAVGTIFSIDNTWRVTSGSDQTFYGIGNNYSVTPNPSTAVSNLVINVPSNANLSRTTATFTMPSGGTTVTFTASGTTDTITTTSSNPAFGCMDVSAVNILTGAVGDAVVVRARGHTVTSVSPSTYQLGNAPYMVCFLVPNSGYSNGGAEVCCSFNATGTTTTTQSQFNPI